MTTKVKEPTTSQVLQAIEAMGLKIEIQSNKIEFQSAKLDAQSAKIDAQLVKIDELTEKNSHLNAKIDSISAEFETYRIEQEKKYSILLSENRDLHKRIEIQDAYISDLLKEIGTLKDRLKSVEERLGMIDVALTGIAPLIRDLMESKSLMLESGYREELRDIEPVDSFLSSSQIAKLEGEILDCSNQFKSPHGFYSAFGKKLAYFYKEVTQFEPRKIKNQYKYWLNQEEMLVSNVIRVFKEVFI